MKNIGITGGTGFVGGELTALLLHNGYNVTIFTRTPERYTPSDNITYALWQPEAQKCDTDALKPLHAVINLAGAGIADKRWTAKRKKEIADSRIEGTRFLVSVLKENAPNCTTFIAASAIGYYGQDNGNEPFTEEAPAAQDFLGQTALGWEEASGTASTFLRTVIFRFGMVLGKDSGAYPVLARPLLFGVMPILGSGTQVVSWIHIHDLARMLFAAINNFQMEGTYNAVAPKPVSQKSLMHTIARTMGGLRIPIHVPAFLLKLIMGEMSTEVLKSCTVSARKLQDGGFTFDYPDIDTAIAAIIGGKHNHSGIRNRQ